MKAAGNLAWTILVIQLVGPNRLIGSMVVFNTFQMTLEATTLVWWSANAIQNGWAVVTYYISEQLLNGSRSISFPSVHLLWTPKDPTRSVSFTQKDETDHYDCRNYSSTGSAMTSNQVRPHPWDQATSNALTLTKSFGPLQQLHAPNDEP